MNRKNILLFAIGVIVLGGVIFLSTRQKTNAPAANPSATGTSVSIENYQFNPSTLTVKKGATVTWTNNDAAAHAVAGDQNAAWPVGPTLRQGNSYTHVFDADGTFPYHCVIHPGMHGTIIVTE